MILLAFKPVLLIQHIESEDLPAFQAAVAQSMQTLEPFTWSGQYYLPSRQQKWIESRTIPELQIDGSVIWDGFTLDITERKLAELQVQQKNQALIVRYCLSSIV